MAVTMTRLRPSTSATAPVNGAVSATANVLTVMMVDTSAGARAELAATAGAAPPAGEYRLMKAQKPASPTASRRRGEVSSRWVRPAAFGTAKPRNGCTGRPEGLRRGSGALGSACLHPAGRY